MQSLTAALSPGTYTSVNASQSHLSIAGLTKQFGDFTALKQVDLTIKEGEFVCFLGPSGCGKTTLLRAIAGLAPQTTGTIIQRGRDISALPPQARDFGIVFQSYALFPNLSVYDNVAYGLRNQRQERQQIRARVAELLALVDLTGSESKYPAALSGGQQQRVALARALATEPGLLLLDEPLSALDARVRVHLRSQMKALQQRLGVTTIMVTHDQEEALTMADRIVVMNHGVIEQIGTPAEIYQHPVSEFVATFVGSMNLLDVASDASGQWRLGHQAMTLTQQRPDLSTEQARLAVRPEAVTLSSNPQDLQANVTHIEFLGAFLRVHLNLEGCDQPLLADISARDAQAVDLKVHQGVGVVLPEEAIRLYPAAGGQV